MTCDSEVGHASSCHLSFGSAGFGAQLQRLKIVFNRSLISILTQLVRESHDIIRRHYNADLEHGHVGERTEHVDKHVCAAAAFRQDEAGCVEAW